MIQEEDFKKLSEEITGYRRQFKNLRSYPDEDDYYNDARLNRAVLHDATGKVFHYTNQITHRLDVYAHPDGAEETRKISDSFHNGHLETEKWRATMEYHCHRWSKVLGYGEYGDVSLRVGFQKEMRTSSYNGNTYQDTNFASALTVGEIDGIGYNWFLWKRDGMTPAQKAMLQRVVDTGYTPAEKQALQETVEATTLAAALIFRDTDRCNPSNTIILRAETGAPQINFIDFEYAGDGALDDIAHWTGRMQGRVQSDASWVENVDMTLAQAQAAALSALPELCPNQTGLLRHIENARDFVDTVRVKGMPQWRNPR